MSKDVTSSSVLQNTHVSTFVYDEAVISMARDCVKGTFDEYYFFQFDSDEYVLIISDDCQMINSQHFSSFASTVIVFYKDVNTVSSNHSVLLDGTITEVGATPSVDQVSLTGSVSDSTDEIVWEISSFKVDSAHIYNTDYLAYGSMGDLPRLVEGVTYYAYSAFCLCFAVIGFKLLDRIFRRIY